MSTQKEDKDKCVLAKGKQEDISEFSCEYIQGPLYYITVARQMKLVTFVQSQMNIRWCFPSDRDQSFPTECFLEAVKLSPCSCSLSEETNVLQWKSAY